MLSALVAIKIYEPERHADNRMIFIGRIHYSGQKKYFNFRKFWDILNPKKSVSKATVPFSDNSIYPSG